MPRAKAPLKRDLLKAELARLLGLPVADVFTREEAGAFLGRHPKTFSNDDGAAPFFYKADLGRNGLAFYTLNDLKLWRDDKAAFGKLRMATTTNERPWPSLPTGTPAPPAPIGLDQVHGLDLEGVQAVLLKTRTEPLLTFDPDFPWLDAEAAAWLANHPLLLVGIDQLGIERNQPDHATHISLLARDILIVEGLDLSRIPGGRRQLAVFTLGLRDVEAEPILVYALPD